MYMYIYIYTSRHKWVEMHAGYEKLCFTSFRDHMMSKECLIHILYVFDEICNSLCSCWLSVLLHGSRYISITCKKLNYHVIMRSKSHVVVFWENLVNVWQFRRIYSMATFWKYLSFISTHKKGQKQVPESILPGGTETTNDGWYIML